MPVTEIRLYRDDDGSTPLVEWLATIETRNRKTYEKCRDGQKESNAEGI